MSLETQLKDEILRQYKSIRAFSNALGISYSTLDSALKREYGIKNAGIEMILKVFSALNLDIESVKDGEIRKKSVPPCVQYKTDFVPPCIQYGEEPFEIAMAFDKADEKSRAIVRLVLSDFMEMPGFPS